MGTDEPLVVLAGVCVSHPLPGGARAPALADCSLEVRAGETLAVLGAGGAGKSTLAAVLAGVREPEAGAVRRAPLPAGRATVPAGLVTQNPGEGFSSPLVREEMGVVLENLDWEGAAVDRAVEGMLAAVGLAGRGDDHPGQLSGGQRQLLALGSALIAGPPLLVLDEHLTLLDGRSRAAVGALVARARVERGAAVVVLTAEVDEALAADRVAVLCRGAVAWEGPPAGLPLDGGSLAAWGLVAPDLARLVALLREGGLPAPEGVPTPETLARALCPSS